MNFGKRKSEKTKKGIRDEPALFNGRPSTLVGLNLQLQTAQAIVTDGEHALLDASILELPTFSILLALFMFITTSRISSATVPYPMM